MIAPMPEAASSMSVESGGGSDVIRDPQGNALDGENTVNGDPNGAQLPLPSGDGFPGGNFYDTFLINTQAPTMAVAWIAADLILEDS